MSPHVPVYPPLRRARPFAGPLPGLWSSASLTPDDLRAYWRFRRGFMDLKPHVDPEDDHARFAAWVSASDFVWFRRARDGRLLGAVTCKAESRTHEGRECTLVWPEYGYVLPEARNSAGPGLACLLGAAVGALRWPGRPIYLVGTGYAAGYVSLAWTFQRIWLREDPGMTPWERSLWRTLAAATKGYDPATQLVEMGTIPRDPRTDPPRDPQKLARYRQYMAHNPRWTEGYTCFLFLRLGLSDLAAAVQWAGLRALRIR